MTLHGLGQLWTAALVAVGLFLCAPMLQGQTIAMQDVVEAEEQPKSEQKTLVFKHPRLFFDAKER